MRRPLNCGGGGPASTLSSCRSRCRSSDSNHEDNDDNDENEEDEDEEEDYGVDGDDSRTITVPLESGRIVRSNDNQDDKEENPDGYQAPYRQKNDMHDDDDKERNNKIRYYKIQYLHKLVIREYYIILL